MAKTVNRIHYDRIYGPIEFTDDDMRLYQTVEMTRLRDLSLSATPPQITATGVCASKFEHTVAVAHLARLVGYKTDFAEFAQDIYFAALAHDLGTPPFSHLSEHYQKLVMKENHEEAALRILDNRNSIFRQEIMRQGGSISKIASYVTGRDNIIGKIINGSIDLDNLDNTLRYGLSKGILQTMPYSPIELAACYKFHHGQLAINAVALPEIEGWEDCRYLVYKYVYSFDNLAGGMMLFRAIGLAYELGEITADFFLMTDNQALNFLQNNTNQRTRSLLDKITRWYFYPRVFETSQEIPSSKMTLKTKDLNARMDLGNSLGQMLKILPEDIAVYIGQSKAFKKIDLPILSKDGCEIEFVNSILKPCFQAHVYLSPDHIDEMNLAIINEYMNDTLGIVAN